MITSLFFFIFLSDFPPLSVLHLIDIYCYLEVIFKNKMKYTFCVNKSVIVLCLHNVDIVYELVQQ